MMSGQETLVIVLLVVVFLGIALSGYVALLRERYKRGRRGEAPPPGKQPRARRRG